MSFDKWLLIFEPWSACQAVYLDRSPTGHWQLTINTNLIPTFPKHWTTGAFLQSRVHLQLKLKPGFHNIHPDCPIHVRIRVMISGIAFNCSDHLSRLRIFPCDHFKFYTIVQFVCKNSVLPKMIKVIPIVWVFCIRPGSHIIVPILWTLIFWDDWGDWNNYGNQVIDKVLGWAACQWTTSLQFCLKPYWLLSANCASKQPTISLLSTNRYWDLRMSNTTCSVNFFLNTHQLSLYMILYLFRWNWQSHTHAASIYGYCCCWWLLLWNKSSTGWRNHHDQWVIIQTKKKYQKNPLPCSHINPYVYSTVYTVMHNAQQCEILVAAL